MVIQENRRTSMAAAAGQWLVETHVGNGRQASVIYWPHLPQAFSIVRREHGSLTQYHHSAHDTLDAAQAEAARLTT